MCLGIFGNSELDEWSCKFSWPSLAARKSEMGQTIKGSEFHSWEAELLDGKSVTDIEMIANITKLLQVID